MQENDINIKAFDVSKEMFRRGMFDFITIRNGKMHKKQNTALKYLTNNNTDELVYGGAAGGAKTWTGCVWLLYMASIYPKTKWFIGRERLKSIIESTLVTIYKVADTYGFNNFTFNGKYNYLEFSNGSRINLLELKLKPSDPDYKRLGSTEYTGGWIEEAGEVDYGAKEVLGTRIGRHYNDRYGIRPKMFITANPTKGWLYEDYYKPNRNKILEEGRIFLPSLVTDNPFIESGYADSLSKIKDKAKYQRLYLGNWDYDDNPLALCGYDDIISIFNNSHIEKNKKRYITADVARFGSDAARIGVWEDWELIETMSFSLSDTTLIQDSINFLRRKYNIPAKNCIADQDGVGGGVVDNCRIKGFVNNARPIKENVSNKFDTPQYFNLQTQCLFYLADKINNNEFYISAEVSRNDKDVIISELSTIERIITNDGKLRVKSKEDIKKEIGHSPDWRDLFLMRSFFDIGKNAGSSSMKIY